MSWELPRCQVRQLVEPRDTDHKTIQLGVLVAAGVATFATFYPPLADDLYFRPIVSPGVPENFILHMFNCCVGKSIGGEEVYKPHTSACIATACCEE